jgi:hypothetical protein
MMCCSFVEDDVVNLEGVQFAGFPLKVGRPVVYRLPHHRVVVFAVGNPLATGLEEDLIDAVLRPQKPESRFQALGQTVSLLVIQTLVIDSLDSEYNANVTAFGQKDLLIQKAKDRYMLIKSAGHDVRHSNSSRAAGFLLVCPLPALRLSGQLPQTISNSRLANGLAIVVFVSLSGKKNLGIESEVLLTTAQVTQKFNGDETDRDLRKPQRGPESC